MGGVPLDRVLGAGVVLLVTLTGSGLVDGQPEVGHDLWVARVVDPDDPRGPDRGAGLRDAPSVAVASVIGGQALLLRSPGVAVWLLMFLTAVITFVHVYEEPSLTEKFGATYERYREAVPGWWPRLTPYRG